MNRILLAYSGSLPATAAIPWLRDTYDAEVVTLSLDLGQGVDLADVRERALASGALRAHVIDAREEFVRDHILPALRAGHAASPAAFAERPLSRALIAKRLVDLARMENASAVAHGCAAEDPDRAALEEAIRTLNPSLPIYAPASTWEASGDDLDVNLWGRTILRAPAESDFRLTRRLDETPLEPAVMALEFIAGVPVRANDVDMPIIELIESIETIAGTHGVGRIALPGGMAAESPAAVVLQAAFSALAAAGAADGIVRVRLSKGSCDIVDVFATKAAV